MSGNRKSWREVFSTFVHRAEMAGAFSDEVLRDMAKAMNVSMADLAATLNKAREEHTLRTNIAEGLCSPPIPPRLREGDRKNFSTLLEAAQNGDVALVSAVRKEDNAPVALVCAMGRGVEDGKKMVYPSPFAVMIEGNPFDDFYDPMGDTDKEGK